MNISESTQRTSRCLGSAAIVFLILGCSPAPPMPPAQDALQAYLKAVEADDAAGLHAMMTERAQQDLSVTDVGALLKRDRNEFRSRAKEFRGVTSASRGGATMFLTGDRELALQLEAGEFRIQSAGLVPQQARTPEDAARQLRDAVLARDFVRIAGALSDEGRAAFQRAFEQLELSLAQLNTAVVDVREDRATIEFLDGRVIALRREGAVWRVEEFE